MIPPASPSRLTTAARPRRLNHVPVAIGCFICATTIGVAGYAVYRQFFYHPQMIATAEEKAADKTQGSKPIDLTKVSNNLGDLHNKPADNPPPATTPPPSTAAPAATDSGLTVDEQARAQAWNAYYAAQAQLVATHNALEQSAHSGLMDPLQGAGGGSTQTPGPASGDQPPAGAGGPNQSPYSVGGTDPAGQTGKQAFLRTAGDITGQDENLKGSVHGPKPMTIMEGTPLPCRISEGATSDMPGQLNAEIMTNVYDTMFGDHLLIPQGTRLVTTYDTAVSAGQDRLGVIGQRLIFPDTSSRQLGSMSIADQSGLAGLKDILNTHFWEKFGSALTIAFIGAGAQLAQPQQSAFAAPSGTAAATGAMTQQLSAFGTEQARAGAMIPNTIELRPGLACLVKLNKDVTLPEYHDARNTLSGAGKASMTVGKFIQ
jgi:type IV secretion system protein TrbI